MLRERVFGSSGRVGAPLHCLQIGRRRAVAAQRRLVHRPLSPLNVRGNSHGSGSHDCRDVRMPEMPIHAFSSLQMTRQTPHSQINNKPPQIPLSRTVTYHKIYWGQHSPNYSSPLADCRSERSRLNHAQWGTVVGSKYHQTLQRWDLGQSRYQS